MSPRGRPKKIAPETPVIAQPAKEETKPEFIEITVKIKGIDEEGNHTMIPYTGKGESVQEALNNLQFPNVHCGPIVTVTRGTRKEVVRISPYKARKILNEKNVDIFKTAFGEW